MGSIAGRRKTVNAIRIIKQIDSETLHLPELKPLIGKRVEIIVLEEAAPLPAKNGSQPHDDVADRWAAAEQAVRELTDYDFDALREQREFDRLHGQALFVLR
jgi:hypothetical protein